MWRRQSAGSNIINDPHWLNTIQYSILIGYLNREFFVFITFNPLFQDYLEDWCTKNDMFFIN